MILHAPAKINLYLKIIRRRDDGYHEIETLFEKISIFDQIIMESSQDHTQIICNNACVPTDTDSLLGQTIETFKERIGKDFHFKVNLTKNIPIGAGLGGGSSDAATLLKGLNQITGFPLTGKALLSIAQTLGADIPFFLYDASFGIGTGRGDIIQKKEKLSELWHVLISPPFEISTKNVYSKVSHFGLTKEKPLDRMFTAFLDKNDVTAIAENLYNDLQRVVLRDFPTLKQVFAELEKTGAKGTLLSGSGPTVFGIFQQSGALRAANKLKKIFPAEENWRVFVARTY